MSKYELKFTLKQHTPIIHFQHEQMGATLRASELKPKLDMFIMKKCLDELPQDYTHDQDVRDKFFRIAKAVSRNNMDVILV